MSADTFLKRACLPKGSTGDLGTNRISYTSLPSTHLALCLLISSRHHCPPHFPYRRYLLWWGSRQSQQGSWYLRSCKKWSHVRLSCKIFTLTLGIRRGWYAWFDGSWVHAAGCHFFFRFINFWLNVSRNIYNRSSRIQGFTRLWMDWLPGDAYGYGRNRPGEP